MLLIYQGDDFWEEDDEQPDDEPEDYAPREVSRKFRVCLYVGGFAFGLTFAVLSVISV